MRLCPCGGKLDDTTIKGRDAWRCKTCGRNEMKTIQPFIGMAGEIDGFLTGSFCPETATQPEKDKWLAAEMEAGAKIIGMEGREFITRLREEGRIDFEKFAQGMIAKLSGAH
jgi:hypothetical protein